MVAKNKNSKNGKKVPTETQDDSYSPGGPLNMTVEPKKGTKSNFYSMNANNAA
jgi:hypothetical protein